MWYIINQCSSHYAADEMDVSACTSNISNTVFRLCGFLINRWNIPTWQSERNGDILAQSKLGSIVAL